MVDQRRGHGIEQGAGLVLQSDSPWRGSSKGRKHIPHFVRPIPLEVNILAIGAEEVRFVGHKTTFACLIDHAYHQQVFARLEHSCGDSVAPWRVLVGDVAHRLPVDVGKVRVDNPPQKQLGGHPAHGGRYVNFLAVPNHPIQVFDALILPITGHIDVAPVFGRVGGIEPFDRFQHAFVRAWTRDDPLPRLAVEAIDVAGILVLLDGRQQIGKVLQTRFTDPGFDGCPTHTGVDQADGNLVLVVDGFGKKIGRCPKTHHVLWGSHFPFSTRQICLGPLYVG